MWAATKWSGTSSRVRLEPDTRVISPLMTSTLGSAAPVSNPHFGDPSPPKQDPSSNPQLSAELGDCDPKTEFKCYNGQCISADKLCDLVADCYDESDERFCGKFHLR